MQGSGQGRLPQAAQVAALAAAAAVSLLVFLLLGLGSASGAEEPPATPGDGYPLQGRNGEARQGVGWGATQPMPQGVTEEFIFTCTPSGQTLGSFECAAGGTDANRKLPSDLGGGYLRRFRPSSNHFDIDISTFPNPLPANRIVEVRRGSGAGSWARVYMADGVTKYSQYTGYETGFRWTDSQSATLSNVYANNSGDVTIKILRETPPSAPTGLSATAGNTQAAISWNNIGDSSVNKWEYSLDGTNWTTMGTSPSLTSYTVTGLTNNTAYTIRVRASNPSGAGASSSVAVTPLAPTNTPTPSPCAGALSASRTTVARGESSNITLAMTDGTLSSVTWSTTAGTLSNQANAGATITAPNTGQGSMTITAAMVCSGWKTTASITISVAYAEATATPLPTNTPTPSPCAGALSASRTTVARGESSNITLTVTQGTLSSVAWSTTAGTLSNQANAGATITAPGSGAGAITVTAVMTCSGWKTTATITINVNYAAATPTPTPLPSACAGSLSGPSLISRGESGAIALTVTQGTLSSVAWSTTAGTLSNQANAGATITAPGSGAGAITVTAVMTCSGWKTTATITINVNYAAPTPTPTPLPSACAGSLSGPSLISRGESGAIALTVTQGTLSSVAWSTTAGTLSNQANAGATITAPGSGAGAITVTAVMTCSGWMATATITINVSYAAPTPTPTPPPTPTPTPIPPSRWDPRPGYWITSADYPAAGPYEYSSGRSTSFTPEDGVISRWADRAAETAAPPACGGGASGSVLTLAPGEYLIGVQPCATDADSVSWSRAVVGGDTADESVHYVADPAAIQSATRTLLRSHRYFGGDEWTEIGAGLIIGNTRLTFRIAPDVGEWQPFLPARVAVGGKCSHAEEAAPQGSREGWPQNVYDGAELAVSGCGRTDVMELWLRPVIPGQNTQPLIFGDTFVQAAPDPLFDTDEVLAHTRAAPIVVVFFAPLVLLVTAWGGLSALGKGQYGPLAGALLGAGLVVVLVTVFGLSHWLYLVMLLPVAGAGAFGFFLRPR